MSRPRLLDEATCQEHYERFVRRAVERESVWTVWGETGPLVVASNREGEARDVYVFFSDEAYARRALSESWPDSRTYTTRMISLFDLLNRWLPGLHRDGHLTGPNWTGDLIGLEVEPLDLQRALHERLSPEVAARHLEALDSAT